jgi:Flp pilus assembly protein TadB
MMAAIAGAVVGLGVTLIVAGFVHQPSTVAPGRRAPRLTVPVVAPVVSALVVGAVVLMASRWPVAALGAAVLVGIVVSSIVGRGEQPRLVEARLDAIATWCEMLRDLLRAGALLPAAIATTATTCPTPIRPAVRSLSARLEREHHADALRRFADDLDDPTGDLVASVLVTAMAVSGNTAELLSELATVTRERVERRKLVEAERAGTRMDMRIILAVCAVAVVSIILFARSDFLAPYRTATGQLVLAAIFAVFIAAVVWARRLASYQRPPRFLTIRSQR